MTQCRITKGGSRRGGGRGSTEPADDVFKIAVGVKAVVAPQLWRDVLGVAIIEENDPDGFHDAVGFIDAMADVVGFTGGSETGAGGLGFIETLKPGFTADDDDVARVQSAVATPFVPAIVWSAGMVFQEELIEDHFDTAGAQPLCKGANALAFGIAGLAVADEDGGHKE